MNYTTIHETVLKDIIDITDDVRKSEYLRGYRTNSSFRSISNASDALTLVFPVICSRSIAIENQTMIAKAIERKAVAMLQMLFSAININNSSSGIDYLRKFHTNLKMDDKLTIDNMLDIMDRMVAEENAIPTMEFQTKWDKVKEDLRSNCSYVMAESLNPHSLQECKIVYNEYTGQDRVIHEGILDDDAEGEWDPDPREMKNHSDAIKNQVLDSDVKKANELVPTVMIVNFINNAEECPIETKLVIGVKAKLYPVDSNDMIERVYSKNQDNNGFLKFVRATTREISFFKDFLFAVDKAKIDALSSSRRGSSSKLWKILERRSLKSRIRRALGQPNDASAISTLVISQEEVEYLKKHYNVYLDNPRVARPIMEAYNLMSMVIVDELNEVANFIFDTGNDVYENVAFRSLERESADNDFKKMITLMTKMR